ncbi:hypothetical protein [Planococcus sp. 107-1]|uniref:hypothetical protein n=1 Tax=Planococcus sp. 107-1 TaxID=2908840 RepID=UPI001F3B7428|nr:hypothetical protein [Planococcus sp. 107-1]UJF27125.1 hypothetical protein L0M13_00850 [Planococcus sp. 107-1]
MNAPEEIVKVWREFDGFPMETLTKAWYYEKAGTKKQRSIELMKAHRERYGITGNCFDLALWLLEEFKKAGIKAYPIGSHLGTMEAHAAIAAEDKEGYRYLCDLGDQWLEPILIEESSKSFQSGKLAGFFPGAEVEVLPGKSEVEIFYYRPNGKISNQKYALEPVSEDAFWEAAEFSQNHIYPKVLFETRMPYKNEIAHWEFEDWQSRLSTSQGLIEDTPLSTLDEWVERLHQKSGFDRSFLKEALEIYKEMNSGKSG